MEKKQMTKAEIIQTALNRIGTTNINLLDGMSLFIDDICYNIYVSDGKVEIDIID